MVHDQGQGWDDDGWGDDDDNGASWFDNVQQPVEPQQQVEHVQQQPHVQPEVVQAQQENVNHLQQVLDAKEAECQTLKSERDDLINVQSTLQVHIESLKAEMQLKIGELEDRAKSVASQNQEVQCQPDMDEKMTDTGSGSEPTGSDPTGNNAQNRRESENSSNQNMFTWDDAFADPMATGSPNDFFNQPSFPVSHQTETEVVVSEPRVQHVEVSTDTLTLQAQDHEAQKELLERQLAEKESMYAQFENQIRILSTVNIFNEISVIEKFP